jgi:cell division protein ZapD
MVVYEQPLNERIRLFLRLEYLLHRFDYYVSDLTYENSQTAIMLLLELHDMSSRLDVKSAIMKLIDHQSVAIRGFGNATQDDDVDTEKINKILSQLETKTKELYSFRGPLGQHLKNNEFINTIKQRMLMAGGVNGFDVPVFNHWINQPVEVRTEQLKDWVAPYTKSRESINIIMDLVRASAGSDKTVAKSGFYHATMDTAKRYQLLRVKVPEGSFYYPEISAGKHRFSIRFVNAEVLETRSKQVQEDIEFSLSLCGF